MKTGLIVLLAVCFAGNAFSQTKRYVDSLNVRVWELCFRDADSARKIARTSLDAATRIHYKKGIAEAKSKLGVMYDLEGKTDQAHRLLHEAINIQEAIRDSVGLSFSYNNLGLLHYAQYNYTDALKYLNKSLRIDQRRGNKKGAVGSMINIGIMYTYLERMDDAESMYKQALPIGLELKDTSIIGACYSNLGKIYFAKKDYTKAIAYYELNETCLREDDNPERHATNFNSLANVYLKLHQYQKALSYAEKDLAVCKRYKLLHNKQFAYETLNEIYQAMGDYQNAHRYLKYYTKLRDKLLNEDRNSAIAEMETKYETEKKEKEIVQVNLDKEKALSRNRSQLVLIVVLSVVSLLIIGFVLWAYFSKRKINKLLHEKNNLAQEIILQKELLMAEVHHRVKNNLQLITSIIDLQLKTIANETAVSNVKDIQKRVESIAVLHQFLYQSDNVEAVDIRQYIGELTAGIKKSFGTEMQAIELNLQVASLLLSVTTAVPLGLIINELVTNSFKHAFGERDAGMITIGLEYTGDELILLVQDNGVGNEPVTESESFGLRMIRSLCRQLNAQWETDAENGLKNRIIIKRFKMYE